MTVEGVSRAEWRRIDRTLLSIQYMRGGAAMVVLIAHAYPAPPGAVMALFALAMDLFFLMSGFIVVIITNEDTRPLEFIRDRLGRIIPLYWLVTLASFFLIYSGVLTPQLDPRALVGNLAQGNWPFLAHSLFFIPAPSPFEPYPNPLLPQGWTLNYEMMFYVTFALALSLPRYWVIPALTLLYAAIVGGGLIWAQSVAALFWTSPLIFEFIFGMWTAVAWRSGWDFRRLYLSFLVAWVPLIMFTFYFAGNWPFQPRRMALLPLVLGFFLLVLSRDRQHRVREWRPARLVGDASYSIYLFHFIPVILVDRLGQSGAISAPMSVLGVVGGGLAGGLAVYFFIEQPIMRIVRARRRARRGSLPA